MHSRAPAEIIQCYTLWGYWFWNPAQGHLFQPHESEVKSSSSSILSYLRQWPQRHPIAQAQNLGMTPILPPQTLSSTKSYLFFKHGLLFPPLQTLPLCKSPLSFGRMANWSTHILSGLPPNWSLHSSQLHELLKPIITPSSSPHTSLINSFPWKQKGEGGLFHWTKATTLLWWITKCCVAPNE